MAMKFDFSGWASRNNMLCSDGRTIVKDAFKDCDGQTVPLVWSHIHDDPDMVLGHAVLENRNEGLYAYCSFNDSKKGRATKHLVEHGDVVSLSIFANQLKQKGHNVLHGLVREVSVVLAGANPGAMIDQDTVNQFALEHGDPFDPEIGVIFTGEPIELYHSDDEGEEADASKEDQNEETDDDEKTLQDVIDTMNEEQKNAMYALVGMAVEEEQNKQEEEGEEIAHSADKEDGEEDASKEETKEEPKDNGGKKEMADTNNEKTLQDVIDTMNEEQKNAMYALIGMALEEKEGKTDENEEGEEEMKHNIFDNGYEQDDFLCHEDRMTILDAAKHDRRSLKDTINDFYGEDVVLAHATPTDGMITPTGHSTYGFNDPSMLFPDYKAFNNTPEWIKRDDSWVTKVMAAVHKSPFSRIKSVFADITAEDARAKGYVTGAQKIEEVFSTLKRTTDPQTIYKKQKMDRDNIIDITDFDVVAWIKAEMRIMLNEEIARAILIGDGRTALSADKIKEDHIRPVVSDVDLFNIKIGVNGNPIDYKEVIKAILRGRKNYKGSGNPTFFTTEEVLTEMLLLEDRNGLPLYKTEAELATKLRVKEIVTVEVMEGQTVTISGSAKDLIGVIVNLADYNVGTDKGGEINYFDDFDIDYNQEKYLIETRMSGALVKPFSAMTIYATGEANP